MRLYKCYGKCNEKYAKSEMLIHSNKNYCSSCYNEVVKDNEDRVELYNLIKTAYGVAFPTSMHMAQIKRTKEHYSYEDMIISLNYCINSLNIKFNSRMGFGYVSNNIEAALANKKDQDIKKQNNENIFANSNQDVFANSVIRVAKPDNTNTHLNSKLIDLEDLI